MAADDKFLGAAVASRPSPRTVILLYRNFEGELITDLRISDEPFALR